MAHRKTEDYRVKGGAKTPPFVTILLARPLARSLRHFFVIILLHSVKLCCAPRNRLLVCLRLSKANSRRLLRGWTLSSVRRPWWTCSKPAGGGVFRPRLCRISNRSNPYAIVKERSGYATAKNISARLTPPSLSCTSGHTSSRCSTVSRACSLLIH